MTDEAQYATVTDGTTAPEAGKPAVAADSDTTYTINGSNVQVADESGVALLYDSIIDANGEDRTSLLEDKAGDALAGMGQTPGEGNRLPTPSSTWTWWTPTTATPGSRPARM